MRRGGRQGAGAEFPRSLGKTGPLQLPSAQPGPSDDTPAEHKRVLHFRCHARASVRAALLGALVVAEPASIVAQAVVVITIECLNGVGAMGA